MIVREKEVIYHIDTYDVGLYTQTALHFSLNAKNNFMCLSCDEYDENQIKYLSDVVGVKLYEIDTLIIYLKRK